MAWDQDFDNPLALPNGKIAETLKQADVMDLPKY